MVDEFQDTDRVQWQVIDRAFSGRSTVILIGDPKQAIYAFRGGDIVHVSGGRQDGGRPEDPWPPTGAATPRWWTGCRWCCAAPSSVTRRSWCTTSRLTTTVTGWRARRTTSRSGCGSFKRPTFGRSGIQNLPIDELREHIGADLAADIRALLASGATFDGEPLQARDIAVIVEQHKDAGVCFQALVRCGHSGRSTPATPTCSPRRRPKTGCALLEAFDQPHRPGVVRAAAATMFFGETAETLVAGGDPLTDRIADTLREWAAHARERGVAAVFEAAQLRGMGDRVLSWQDGERQMTDLAHVTQLLQEVAHRERLGLPALRDWLRKQRDERSGATERNRRLDSDAAAVQVMTVYVAKGLQFPVVYLPFAFNRNVQDRDIVLFHDDDGVRCLYIGGKNGPGFAAVAAVRAAARTPATTAG